MKKFVIICLFIILKFITCYQNNENKNSVGKLYRIFIKSLIKNSNSSLFIKHVINNKKCMDEFNKNNTDILYENSGKYMMDFGNQQECEESSNQYIFLNIKIDLDKYVGDDDPTNQLLFLYKPYLYLGICVWNNCNEYYRDFFDKSLNIKFFDYLNNFGIIDVEIYDKKDEQTHLILLSFFWVMIGYITIRAVIFLLISIYEFREESMLEQIEHLEILSKSNDSQRITSNSEYYLVEDSPFDIKTHTSITKNSIAYSESDDSYISSDYMQNLSKNKEFIQNEINSCLKKLSNKISNDINSEISAISRRYRNTRNFTRSSFYINISLINDDVKYLFNVKNEFYDDTNLEILAGLRSFLLFWIILDRITTYLFSVSWGFSKTNFYDSFSFIFIKFSTFSAESILLIDAFVYTYKLMNFVKNEKNKSFKTFMKFFFNVSQKFLIFFVIFFIFTLHGKQISHVFKSSFIFDHLFKLMSRRDCFLKPYNILIPFYYQYNENFCDEAGYGDCLKYVYYCINEVICMFVTNVLFYFIYKFKSKRFDKYLCLILFSLYCICFLNYDLNSEKYTLKYVMGETLIYRKPHMLFFVFLVGINCGLVYFYYIDSLCDASKYEDKIFYFPFSFNYSLMKKMIHLSKLESYSICLISFLILLLISSTYTLSLFIFENAVVKNLLFDFDFFFKFVFVYEKKIYILVFSVLLTTFVFLSEKNILSTFFDTKIFITISRISLPFICCDIFIYIIFSFIEHEVFYFIYSNYFIMTLALYGFLFIFSFLITWIFELPIRILYKKMLRSDKLK